MILAIFLLLICTGVKGFDEDVPRFFTNGHGGFQFYHAQEKYEKPHKHRTTTTTTTTEIPQETTVETTSTTMRTIPTTTSISTTVVAEVVATTVSSESSSTTGNVRRIVSTNLRRRRPTTTIKTSSSSEDLETTTRFSNFLRRRPTTVKPESTSVNLLESSVNDEEENSIKTLDLVKRINSSSATEANFDFGNKFNRFYKKERTTTEENNEIFDISTENVKKFTPKIYTSNFKLRRPTVRTTTEKTNPKIKRHDVHVLNANAILEKRRKIYQGYIRKPPSSTKNSSQVGSNKIPATVNRKSMPKIQITNRNFTVNAKTNSTLNKDLYSRRPSEKYMQLRQKEKPKVEAGISALRKRHLSSLNYFRQHALKFS